VILAPFVFFVTSAFWIFVLWMLWLIASSLKGMSESLKLIARNSGGESEHLLVRNIGQPSDQSNG